MTISKSIQMRRTQFQRLFQCSFNNYLNIYSRMSQQKIPIPPPPLRYPMFPYPSFIPDKMKQMQPNLIPNSTTTLSSNPNSIPTNQFIPPRVFNPYLGGYNMFPMGQAYPPYMPMMRNMPIPPPPMENSKGLKQTDDKSIPSRPFYGRVMPPFFNPGMFMPPQFATQPPTPEGILKKIPIPTNKAPTQQTQSIQIQKNQKKQIKPIPPSTTQTQVVREQPKLKIKQPKHADIKPYQPEEPKKKKKKEPVLILNPSQRETREKKQSIEKIMDLVMRQKPLRDRIIKIGKQFQAIIPESFINEYEYNLKIKLQKKKNLLSRLVSLK